MNGDNDYDDIVNMALAPSLNRAVRGADKLKGVRPELVEHWNKLDQEFKKAGIVPEIKSGYRTAEQQNALYRNPTTRARTKGNDGYTKISPHQRGDALDVSFTANQRALGRRILAQYAQSNGLHIPSDEPWHITLTSQKPQIDPYADVVDAAITKETPQPQTDPYDDVIQAALGQPLKTPQITSTVKEWDSQEEIPTGAPPSQAPVKVAPVPFLATRGRPKGPTELMMSPFDEAPPTSVREDFERQRFKRPDSLQIARRVKLQSSTSQLSPEDVESLYIRSLGTDYEKLNEQHRAETGQNIVKFRPSDLANIRFEKDGSFYISPNKGAIDYLNAYAQGGLPKAREEFARQLDEQNAALKTAREGAKQDVAEVEAARKSEGVESAAGRVITGPTERFIANIGKTVGGLSSLGGLTPNQFSDYMNRKSRITELGASLPPLTAQGKEIQKNIPEEVGTKLVDLGYTVFEIAALKKISGLSTGQVMALETALKTSDENAPQRAAKIAQSYAMGKILDSHLDRLTSGAIFGVPAGVEGAQQVAQWKKDWSDVALDVGVQGGVGAILGGGKGEGLTELGIGRGTQNAQIETQPNVETQLEGAKPQQPQARYGMAESSEGNRVVSLVVSNAEPPRHVDLQPRRQRGEGKGQFKSETRAQREERLAAVSNPPNQPLSEPPVSAEPSDSEAAQPVKTETTASPAREPWQIPREEWRKPFLEASDNWKDLNHPSHAQREQMKESARRFIRERVKPDMQDIATTNAFSSGEIGKGELHRRIVEEALSEGKPVPPEVLKDYPDLAVSEGVASTSAPNRRVAERRVASGKPPLFPEITARRESIARERTDAVNQLVNLEANQESLIPTRRMGERRVANTRNNPIVDFERKPSARPANIGRKVDAQVAGLGEIRGIITKANPDGSIEISTLGGASGLKVHKGQYQFAEGRFTNHEGLSREVVDYKTGASKEFPTIEDANREVRRLNKLSDAELDYAPTERRGVDRRKNSPTEKTDKERVAEIENIRKQKELTSKRIAEIDSELASLTSNRPERRVSERRTAKPAGVSVPEGKPIALTLQGKSIDLAKSIPSDALQAINRTFNQTVGPDIYSELPENPTGQHVIDLLANMGLSDQIISQSASKLKALGYSRIGDVEITDEGLRHLDPSIQRQIENEQANLTDQIRSNIERQSRSPQPETKPVVAREPNVTRETLPPEPSATSAKKAQVDIDRAARGVEPLPWSPKSKSDVDLLNSAKEANAKNPEAPQRLTQEVLTKPRALSDKETVQIDLRKQELSNQHGQLLKEIGETSDPDVLAAKRAEFDAIEKDFDDAERALRLSGTEKGRGLRSQQVTINQDFELLPMLNRYKAKIGKEPSPEIRKEIEGYRKRIAELEKQAADREIQPTVQKIQREARRERRQVTKKVLDDEAATIKQNIAAEFARLKSQQSSTHSLWGLGNLDPEGVITREALKYVRNRVEAGVTDTAQLIDDVHGVLSEFVDGVTKRQVAEMISGYGRPTQQTRSELQKQIDALKVQMRQELRDMDVEAGVRPSGRPQGPRLSEGTAPREGPELGLRHGPKEREGWRRIEGPRLMEGQGRKEGPRITEAPKVGPKETRKAIESRYNKQIQELERRIRDEDFGPRKRGPTVLDAQTRQLQVQVERAKQDYDRALRKWRDSQRSKAEKVADLLVNWGRAAKLSYVSTLGKLSGAATGRMVMSPLENLIGEIPHRLSPELSRKATTEGGGFDRAAEVAALWKSGRFRQVLDQLTKGGSDLDVLFGPQGKMADKEIHGRGVLGIPGRVHGALKEYPRQAEFDRQRVKVLRAYEREGRDITSPDVQLAANMEAFNSAERARFQQRNFISDGFNDLMRKWESRGGMAKGAAKLGRFTFPITRVPVNVVGETLNYTFGLPRAAAEHAWRTWRGSMDKLTPEQADNIFRAYKKGGVGLAVMAYAFTHPEQFGGYYQPHDKRKEGEPKPGEMMFFGKRIPKWATHIPILEAAQLAATSRRVMDKLIEKGESKTDALTGGAIAAGSGLASQIPFYETPARFAEGVKSGREAAARLAGQQVKGVIPGFIQEAARVTDKNDVGETVSRKRTGFVEEIQEGIPGLRRRLSESRTERANFKDRLLEGMRKGKSADLDRLVESGKISEGERQSLERESEMTPRQVTFSRAFPDQSLARYERMDENQRMEVREIMEKKAWSLLNSDKLTEAQKEGFQKRIDALGIEPRNPNQRTNSFIPSFRTRFQQGARP